MMKIIKAMQFGFQAHKGQYRRESGLEYISHPLIVAEFARSFKTSKNIDDIICASILHDVLEDTDVTYDELVKEFGTSVAKLVQELTSDSEEISRIGKNAYLIEKMTTMSSYALVIKLCDRLSNIMDGATPKYLKDTRVMIDELCARRKELSETHKVIIQQINEVLDEYHSI